MRTRSALALLCVAATLHAGCASFIVRPYDGPVKKTAKVLTRTASGVVTLGGTEVAVYAAKKNEQIAATYDQAERAQLEEQKNNVVMAWWLTVGLVLLVVAVVGLALSADSSGGGYASGPQCRIRTDQGTCSYHGGVANCQEMLAPCYGETLCYRPVAICADGEPSPGWEECRVSCN